MRIQELEGVEFHCLSVSRLSDIFFNASSCRIGRFRFRCLTKVGMSECKVFEGKYYPEQNAVERSVEIFSKTEGSDLAAA